MSVAVLVTFPVHAVEVRVAVGNGVGVCHAVVGVRERECGEWVCSVCSVSRTTRTEPSSITASARKYCTVRASCQMMQERAVPIKGAMA